MTVVMHRVDVLIPNSQLAQGPGHQAEDVLRGDARWILAKRVAASQVFVRSARLSQLLLYLCEKTIRNLGRELTEHNIAAEVFERRRDFDSGADTIVRSHMLRLRQKLDAYFAADGRQEPIRISIPKGGYVPSFEPQPSLGSADVDVPPSENPVHTVPAVTPATPYRYSSSQVACVILAMISLTLLLVLICTQWPHHSISDRSAKHHLWSSLFHPGSTTTLVAADSGLVMLHGMTGENTTLREYLNKDIYKGLPKLITIRPDLARNIADRRYTSMVDLELFERITHRPEAIPGSYRIKYARDLTANDLKSVNLILSGSQDANPWVELFEGQMNFVLEDDLLLNKRTFMNREPRPSEPRNYLSGQYEYGVLAFLPNPSGPGNALLIEGTSVAGTEATSDLLFEDGPLEAFLAKVQRADGSIPYFETLIRSQSLNGSASDSTILSYRIHP